MTCATSALPTTAAAVAAAHAASGRLGSSSLPFWGARGYWGRSGAGDGSNSLAGFPEDLLSGQTLGFFGMMLGGAMGTTTLEYNTKLDES